MLELGGITLPLARLDGTTRAEQKALRAAVLKMLHLAPSDLASLELFRRSVDARKKHEVHLTCTARLTLRGGANAERALLAKARSWRSAKQLKVVTDAAPRLPMQPAPTAGGHPVVVGAGCAGLFCALALARAGWAPILVERGDGSRERTAAIERFNKTGILDPQSNIQFGLGGAGTFSDGKLSTGTKSPYHRLILQTLVEAGASPSILWDAKPHVGSDILPTVVENVLATIRQAGGEVRLRTQLTDLTIQDGRVQSITLTTHNPLAGSVREERLACTQLILACGHSARDVYQLLKDHNVALERKTFAMGVRIEHLQASIDRAQYGPSAGHPALGAAPYKLAVHLPSGRGAFSFCMCPGGYVVAAASEPEGVVTNGMSLSDRAGTNANAGLLANVFPEDLPGDDVLAGIALQRQCEQAAFAAGGGSYRAPAQLVGDFLNSTPSTASATVLPTYPRGVSWGSIDGCLPPYITQTLREAIPLMARRLRGFDAADAVLTGVETRSSSPVRITRDADGQSVSTQGLYPCGEGAGYAGGIMSAATDGLRCAAWVMASHER